ncbi:MAG: alpha/beta fold hydrolase [Pseudomonadota bacterium]|uniref:alpha/beta fold hydrolase n=1 Tax=Thermithiobacillus tepidarius TaxID=929 RepID=UPI0003F643B6|nr:alpha/beta hydrolase [Thermithiobacillus tepidarius]
MALGTALEHLRLPGNGVTLHVAAAGEPDGPLVLLLHGFPDLWLGWLRQVEALAAAGWRVWAPDQRGYNSSDKPHGLAAYRLEELAADVLALIRLSGRPRVTLIGHDWGGVVAWWLAARHPEVLERLVVLNAPHPAAMRRELHTRPGQLLRSAYVPFFALPWLPERVLRLRDFHILVTALRGSSRPDAFADAELEQYRAAWRQPGALTAMLNWYRALVWRRPLLPDPGPISVPTLLIWGVKDPALAPSLAQASIQLCEPGRLVFVPDAGHWVMRDATAQVNELLLGFLATA